MSGRTGGKRPSLTRAETIESCNSDDLVTVLEVHDRKPYKIMDRSREIKKGVMAESLDELIERGKEKLNYPMEKEVYVVLEEDGTEVDEEEYFQTLPENTLLMLLHVGDKWSPFGPPFTPVSHEDEIDGEIGTPPTEHYHQPASLFSLLERLVADPGYIALLSGKELELLIEMDVEKIISKHQNTFGGKFEKMFLRQLQEAADRHLLEKNEIRDALGLLKLYHQANSSSSDSSNHSKKAIKTDAASPNKRRKDSK